MNISLRLCGALAGLVLTASGTVQAQGGPRLAVLPLTNRTNWGGTELGKSAAAQLTTELVGTAAFTLIERARVDAVYDEWAVGHSGAVPVEEAVEIGRLLQAEYLLLGDLIRFDIQTQKVGVGGIGFGARTVAKSETSVRMIRVETGEIVDAASAEGAVNLGTSVHIRGSGVSGASEFDSTTAERALEPAIKQIAAELRERARQLPDRSRAESAGVPLIVGFGPDGGPHLNQGQGSGMAVGRRFQVVRVVGSILDVNGQELDPLTEVVGVIEVRRVLTRSSIAAVIQGEVAAGDRLEPVADP